MVSGMPKMIVVYILLNVTDTERMMQMSTITNSTLSVELASYNAPPTATRPRHGALSSPTENILCAWSGSVQGQDSWSLFDNYVVRILTVLSLYLPRVKRKGRI